MYVKLTIPERLKDLREEKKLTLEQLSEQTGLSRSALGQYENDDWKEVSAFAVTKLAQFYGVTSDYLLGLSENRNPANAELQSLHLSDDMVELLASGKINNRLLCEMALHPTFARMMIDIEVCVDRIADMRIDNMNEFLERARQTVMEQNPNLDDDLYLRTLELAQVPEDIFFGHVLHEELDTIVKDIRSAHEADSTTADKLPTASTTSQALQEMMQRATSYKGSDSEKRAYLVCQTLQIDYLSLSREEQDALGQICNKSKALPSTLSRRGKATGAHSKGKKSHQSHR